MALARRPAGGREWRSRGRPAASGASRQKGTSSASPSNRLRKPEQSIQRSPDPSPILQKDRGDIAGLAIPLDAVDPSIDVNDTGRARTVAQQGGELACIEMHREVEDAEVVRRLLRRWQEAALLGQLGRERIGAKRVGSPACRSFSQ